MMWKTVNGRAAQNIRTCEGHHNIDWTIDQMQGRMKKIQTNTDMDYVDQTNNWVILQNASGVSLLYSNSIIFPFSVCREHTNMNTHSTHTHWLNGNKPNQTKPNHNTINMNIFVYYIIFSASKARSCIMLPIFFF